MQKLCLGCMTLKENAPVCNHCGYDERQQNLPHQLQVGTLLQNQYLVGRVLGQGGFGITYMGWDQHLAMPVAIKEYYPNGVVQRHTKWGTEVYCTSGEAPELFEKHRERFLKEARTLAKLAEIPQIVQIRSYFAANGTAYIVMEYVQGQTLKSHLKQLGRPMTEKEALAVMEPVLLALKKVHEQNLVHRDISPDNIMLPEEGGVKLIDFGTVRYVGASGETKSTEALLKPGFAPIEQYNARGNLGTWTDVYAICATFHYLLTGKVPTDAPSRIEEGDRLPLLEDMPGISAEIVQSLKKGLAIRPADRIQTVAQLYDAIYKKKTPDESLEKKETSQKKPIARRMGVLAACGVLCALTAVLLLRKPNTPELPETQPQTVPQTVLQVTEPAETYQPTQTPTETEAQAELWRDNVLLYDGDENAFLQDKAKVVGTNILRSQVKTVTFLDQIPQTDAPQHDVSEDRSGRVLAWVEGSAPNYDLYFAAEGGINAKGKACRGLFAKFTNLESVAFNGNFHTDEAIDMFDMFYDCRNLRYVDVETLKTPKVRDTSWMFANCQSLQTLDLSNFNTSNVTTMECMFGSCIELIEIDLSSFDTANVTNMSRLFESCTLLQRVEVSNIDTSAVEDMYRMFYDCQSMMELDLSALDTANLSRTNEMFKNCRSLQKVNLSGWDTSWLENMEEMFCGCESLRALDLSHFNTSRVTNMTRMLAGCDSLRNLELGEWETENVSGVYEFYHSSKLPDGRVWTELFWKK